MNTYVLFVATYDPDRIAVSDLLPTPRPHADYLNSPLPVLQGYGLTHLIVRADTPPTLPEGDLTREGYREWRSIFSPECVTERGVGLLSPARDPLVFTHEGLCVDIDLKPAHTKISGTGLVAKVTNIGPYPIGQVVVMWGACWDQPSPEGYLGGFPHFRPLSTGTPSLGTGESRLFVLMNQEVRECMSYAASLPDQHYVTVSASLPGQEGTHEIMRIPAEKLVDMINNLEDLLEAEELQE